VPGIADRRRRLRSDPAGFEETLTELWFAAWLRSHQRSFEWPPQGSDFVISLDPATTLPLEATTPRQARWMQDLFERLHLVALRFGYEVRVDHEAEMLPTGFDPEQVVISTVTDILNTLRTTTGRSKRRPRFIYKELALTITMKPSIDPVILQSSYSGPVSSYWGFEYIVAAARAKAAQLPRSAPSALLLGTRQLPDLIWNRFIDTLRRDPTFDQGLEWSRMPAHITYVLLFTFNLKSIQPFEAFVLTNPESPFEHPVGLEHFLTTLFPYPLSPTQQG